MTEAITDTEEQPLPPVIEKKKGISLIWLLPLIALMIGGWLIYKKVSEAGIEINIAFDNAGGIEAGKTRIMYKGLAVGVVKKINVSEDLELVTVMAEMIPDAKPWLSIDTQFWLVKPNISVTGVSGLETLVSGNYIGIKPAAGEVAYYFESLSKPPPIDPADAGLSIQLKANELGSIDRGSPVYYRKVSVGQVRDYHLSESDDSVIISVHIDEDYEHLVKKNTRFWNTSGLKVKASLSGVTVQSESLAAMIAGGIAFFSPDGKQTELSEEGDQFRLYPDYESAEVGINAVIRFTDGSGLEEGGTEIKYNGLTVGEVKRLRVDEQRHEVVAEVVFDPHVRNLLRQDTQFWLVTPSFSLSGVSGLNTLVRGSYIGMQPGEGKSSRDFAALQQSPSVSTRMPGLHIQVRAETLGSLDRGSPVLYKKVKVGDVQDYSLSEDGDSVLIRLFIQPAYAYLVKVKSRFWNASGVELHASPTDFSLRTGSISSIVAGGIEFLTPDAHKRSAKISNGRVFPLFDNYQAASRGAVFAVQGQRSGLNLKLVTDELGSLQQGSPVYYKKVPVGEVTGYELARDLDRIIVQIHIEPAYVQLIKQATHFWNASGIELAADISGIKLKTQSITSLVAGGIAFFTPEKGSGASGHVQANGYYTLYDDYDSARMETTAFEIHFGLAPGIQKGALIQYQGLTVGKVKSVELGEQSAGVVVKAVLFGDARQLARQGSLFWVVGPELGLLHSANLDTAIKGSRIDIMPGDGAFQYHFNGLEQAPIVRMKAIGLTVTLQADSLGSVRRGDPVYYRQVPVGKVLDYELSANASQVMIYINIESRYTALVRENSKFWNASGVKLDLSLLDGLEVTTESLEAILAGGIAFATPSDQLLAEPMMSGKRFVLHRQAEAAWLGWAPEMDLAVQP